MLAGLRSLYWLDDVPVDDALPDETEEPVADLGQVLDGLVLVEFFPFLHQFLEVGIAQLLDDVIKSRAFHDIIESYDVGAFQVLQNLYFSENGRTDIVI